MLLHMYMYTFALTHRSGHIDLHTSVHAHIHSYMSVCIHACIHVEMLCSVRVVHSVAMSSLVSKVHGQTQRKRVKCVCVCVCSGSEAPTHKNFNLPSANKVHCGWQVQRSFFAETDEHVWFAYVTSEGAQLLSSDSTKQVCFSGLLVSIKGKYISSKGVPRNTHPQKDCCFRSR